MKKERFILASTSPRRKELFSLLHVPFSVIPSDVEEVIASHAPPEEVVVSLATQKAQAVATDYPNHVVIGADTVVVKNQKILVKPADAAEAKQTLEALSGHTHSVLTGVCIFYQGKSIAFFETTEVTFRKLEEDEILTYIEGGSPFDKAGSYGIQDEGALFVSKITGSYHNVVGLPISQLYACLKEHHLF